MSGIYRQTDFSSRVRTGLFAGLHLDAELVLEDFELLESGGAPLGHAVLEDDDGGDATISEKKRVKIIH